ncbi:MAG: hypothetical protein AAB641_02405 [Patescibacteria group bacterium]
MIKLSNGHSFEYMTASGALGFDGEGWLWEKPLVALKIMKPELFTIVLRTLTLKPRLYPVSNLSWIRPWTWLPWSPYSCVRLLPNGGAVNKVGLYNPGIEHWQEKIAPKMRFQTLRLVGSIYGERHELVDLAERLNWYNLVALEINVSCSNTGRAMDAAREVVESVRAVKAVSRHPIIIKLLYDQDCIAIAQGATGYAEAVSLNSVPWKYVFSLTTSPLDKIGKSGSGGGGVSGPPSRPHNWKVVEELAKDDSLPVIGPSVMDFEDLVALRQLGAKAISFGTIHLRTPWKPTQIVEKELAVRRSLVSLVSS